MLKARYIKYLPLTWQPILVVMALLGMLISSEGLAGQKRVLLIASKEHQIYQNVIRAIRNHLNADDRIADQLILDISRTPDHVQPERLKRYDLLVPIGTEATRFVLDQDDSTPVFSSFIPKRTFESLTAAASRRQDKTLSALYLEQPFRRQLQLLQLIQPDSQRIGTVLGPNSSQQRPALEQAVARMSWQLNLRQLQKNDNPIEALTPVIASSDAFIAVPDRSIFNRSTAKWILLMTFRQRIPLIAYSKRYVDAGAVAAVYSTPESVGLETAQWLQSWLQNPDTPLPPARYPQLFDVSVNPGTARSLRLQLPPLALLKERMSTP